eukprot:4084430-Prymnesium_polylepis.1
MMTCSSCGRRRPSPTRSRCGGASLADVPPLQRVGAHLRGVGDGGPRGSPPPAGRQAGQDAA